ncbi:MAG TPA: PDZ domain-containing protein [Bacillota bacterium]|nr:PDZ domain-containing protein [Bacillota bacterium]
MSSAGRLVKVVLAIIVLLYIAFIYQTDYVLIKPGSAEELRPLITVEGADPDDTGKLYLVTVTQQRANVLTALYGLLHPHIDLRLLGEVIPEGMTQEEYREILDLMMEESKLLAKLIALRRAGYQVEIISEGTIVEGFLDGSPSLGVLQKGDIITAVDGVPVSMASEAITLVQNRRVGDAVRLTIKRGETTREVEITTREYPDSPGTPALGIYIRTVHGEPVLPLDIEMDTGKIGGPSAGLMFVLEILNQLTPGDITGGHLIAGTGTIDTNERVGRIGGVFQKVIAAERAGAEFFIVPEGNYEEARKAAREIELVPVSTLQDVLDFLEGLSTGSAARPGQGMAA